MKVQPLKQLIADPARIQWLDRDDIRPYVYVRDDNRIENPGSAMPLDWFPHPVVRRNPLKMEEVGFANLILDLEHAAFEKSAMPMPRWVFYDCAIIPGFVAGFAIRRESMTPELQAIYPRFSGEQEWVPISLFIVIPTMAPGEWVAHNLCSFNSLLPRELRFYGLGFLTKAFALWYANIEVCCGMTQWLSPALSLHSHYGELEILTAYTPVHDYPETLTYRLKVDPHYWQVFFSKKASESFGLAYEKSSLSVVRNSAASLKKLQSRIERGEGPFFIRPSDMRSCSPQESLSIYLPS